ncbi:PREDICTED: uncharacterized protein LOC108579253 [Habropoda laboriosa]|uniref:uncharacterized protein LOC108579253 n=1 Tax=Habropoda laboriosa TaxID=597456 RepID=UPI00083E32DA|nr:PREDICTED: uncharacterized protein LOC108579253 [Habropoda laboriosa]
MASSSRFSSMKMNRMLLILLLMVCALWDFGDTLDCNSCGPDCVRVCNSPLLFQACCRNTIDT